MSKRKVLVIDDDVQVRRLLRAGFELDGDQVLEADTGMVGFRAATLDKPDLIILEPLLPDIDGSDVLERIRSWSNVPIIALSIESDEEEKVRLLRLGADDYVVKPFGMSELLARAEAILRPCLKGTNRDPVVKTGALSVDLVARVVSVAHRRVQLTPKEYALLQTLAAHAGLVVTQKHLMHEIWGMGVNNIQYLRILVRKLRQKIESDPTNPSLIVSESGVGYRLVRDVDSARKSPSASEPTDAAAG